MYKPMALKLRATIILLFCAVGLPMNAQNGGIHPNIRETLEQMESIAKPDTVKKVILDYAQYQIYYEKVYHPIPSVRQPEAKWIQVLQVGSQWHAFANLGNLQADSIWDASIRAGKRLVDFYTAYSNASYSVRVPGWILLNNVTDTLEFYDRIFVEHYCYKEPIPKMEWKLLEGDTIVAGYACKKASTYFRGRDYIAWYTEEVPLAYGPYKFRGLPGLITCLYDTARDHSYSLVGLEKVQGKYIYRKPNKNTFNTTRLGLLKAKKNYTSHPDGYKSDKIISHTGSAKKQNIPYNPIELE